MALYSYEALSKEGKKVRGVVDAPTVASAREALMSQGLYPIRITLAGERATQSIWSRLFARGASTKQKILLTRQFAILLKSGIPLLQALELLIDQFDGAVRTALVAIRDDVKEGISLADAMQKFPKIFDNIYVQLVRAGEASGRLEIILERLTLYLERRDEIARKIRGALQQPVIQLIVAIVVVTILLTTVVPQLAGTLQGLGQKLPWQTRFLMAVAHFLTHHAIAIVVTLVLAGIAFTYWKRTPSGLRTMDRIKLHVPLLGYITRIGSVVQFSYTLGMLLEGGVNLAQALDIVVSIIDNRLLADKLREARDKIIKQGRVSDYLKQTGIFPPIAIYLLQTGEQSGQLDVMLLTVAKNYEEDLAETIDRVTGLLGPATLIMMAFVVGFIIMSVVGPIMSMVETMPV
jgi:type II secretory pathway component PulF